jgi:peptide/nickel transport system substrate-binding protein
MRSDTRKFAAACAVVLVTASCTGGEPVRLASARRPDLPTGGTLRVGAADTSGTANLDPQVEFSRQWGVLQCCLVRTLLYTASRTVEEGAAQPVPDLAESPPTVSRDGLSWTFHLRRGVHYAPPLGNTEIEAQDFVRALERVALDPAASSLGYAFYYSVVEGFDRFSQGRADSISGLEVRGTHTLVVHTTEPVGHIPDIFSLPATSPIPPDPHRPDARLGVAEGHGGEYGRFIVASGPYMFEGAEDLDLSLPPKERVPMTGFKPGTSITLVRNPSWEPESDPLRPAYVDRIEIVGLDSASMSAALRTGEIDLSLDDSSPPAQVDEFNGDPELRDRVLRLPANEVWFVPLNLALPPFDDIHVRRALNYVVNKRRLTRVADAAARPLAHLAPDFIENNLLLDYDPFQTPEARGDPVKARDEFSRSRYDVDGDGRCDHRVCKNLPAITFRTESIDVPATARSVVRDLRAVGIHLDLKTVDVEAFFTELGGPTKKLAIAPGYASDFLSGRGYFPPLFSGPMVGHGCCNYSMVSASPRRLRSMGYPVTRVPNVEDRLTECGLVVGAPQARCWAEFDLLLMENVVPWIPLLTVEHDHIVSERVVNHSQRAGLPALDHFAIRDR